MRALIVCSCSLLVVIGCGGRSRSDGMDDEGSRGGRDADPNTGGTGPDGQGGVGAGTSAGGRTASGGTSGSAAGVRNAFEEPVDPTLASGDEPLRDLVAGTESPCGVDEQGRLRCEDGGYDFGEPVVGLEVSSPDHRTPMMCVVLESGKSYCDSFVDSLNESFSGQSLVQTSGSHGIMCALTFEHEVHCWDGAVLHDANYIAVAVAWPYACALSADGDIRCFRPDEGASGESVQLVAAPEGPFSALWSNGWHDPLGCAIRPDGELVCWKWDIPTDTWELRETPQGQFTEVVVASPVCALDTEGTVLCGDTRREGPYSHLSVDPEGTNVCALDQAGLPVCWSAFLD